MEENESLKIRNISFLCTIGVLILHSYDPTYSNSTHLAKCVMGIEYYFSSAMFGHFCVSLFFAISGYLIAFGITSKDEYIRKLKRRVSSLFFPYIFWTLACYVFYLFLSFLPVISSFVSESAKLSMQDLWLAISSQKYASHMWYVRNLLIYNLTVPLLLMLFKRKYTTYILFALMIISILVGYNFAPFYINRYLLFALGGYLGNRRSFTFFFAPKKCISIICLILFVTYPFVMMVYRNTIIDSLGYVLMPLFGWYAYDLLNLKKTIKYSNYGFIIYCGHRIIIECFKHLIKYTLHDNAITMIISYIISPCISFAIVLISAMIIKHYLPRTYIFISGNR